MITRRLAKERDMKRRRIRGVSVAAAAFAQSRSDGWPSRPVRVVCPFAPGGSQDALARRVAGKLGELLGQQFVVENRGGAGGTIAYDMVAKAAPDGYSLLLGGLSSHAPTFAESGFPEVVVTSWSLLAVPKGTPAAIKQAIHGATARAVQSADLVASMAAGGFEPGSKPVAEAEAFIKTERARWGEVIRAAGIKPE